MSHSFHFNNYFFIKKFKVYIDTNPRPKTEDIAFLDHYLPSFNQYCLQNLVGVEDDC